MESENTETKTRKPRTPKTGLQLAAAITVSVEKSINKCPPEYRSVVATHVRDALSKFEGEL